MTTSKNTNDPHPAEQSGNKNQNGFSNSKKNDDEDWSAFLSEHEDDLKDIINSRSAKNFEKRLRKAVMPKDISSNKTHEHKSFFNLRDSRGPRDNIQSSWLDVDKTMDEYGDDFIPPDPHFSSLQGTLIVLWLILLLGVAGVFLAAFLPHIASYVGIFSAFCVLIGGAGLLSHRRKSKNYQDYDEYENGARV